MARLIQARGPGRNLATRGASPFGRVYRMYGPPD